MKTLTKQQEKTVANIFSKFRYLADAVGHDAEKALRYFRRGRDVNKREAELLVLNFLHLYENNLKHKPFQSQTGLDSGLYKLVSVYERIRGVHGFEELDLDQMHSIYLDTRGCD